MLSKKGKSFNAMCVWHEVLQRMESFNERAALFMNFNFLSTYYLQHSVEYWRIKVRTLLNSSMALHQTWMLENLKQETLMRCTGCCVRILSSLEIWWDVLVVWRGERKLWMKFLTGLNNRILNIREDIEWKNERKSSDFVAQKILKIWKKFPKNKKNWASQFFFKNLI